MNEPASTAPAAAGHPLVRGRCPACNGSSLFLGSGGYVTCSRLDCPNPTLADDLLHQGRPDPRLRNHVDAAHNDGPSVDECAQDRAHWTQKYAGE